MGVITTERLSLLPMTPEFLECTAQGREADARKTLGLEIPPTWFEHGPFAAVRLKQLAEGVTALPWLPRAIAFRGGREMIGYIGFHTSPAPEYLKDLSPHGVELGYEIFPAFRRQRIAWEASLGLMDWARSQYSVKNFVVSVSPQNAASLSLIAKMGFRKIGSHVDDEDGPEDIFELVLNAKQA
ncbi:MAG: GNAT family protein [Nibricoccus sp.]